MALRLSSKPAAAHWYSLEQAGSLHPCIHGLGAIELAVSK